MGFAVAPAPHSASESPAWPAPPEAPRKNPLARGTSRLPTRQAARSAAFTTPANEIASAGKPLRRLWISCGDSFCTRPSPNPPDEARILGRARVLLRRHLACPDARGAGDFRKATQRSEKSPARRRRYQKSSVFASVKDRKSLEEIRI